MIRDKYIDVLDEISTLSKEDREKVVKLFEYFDVEFDNIVWNHSNLEIVDKFRQIKRYWKNAKYIIVNCEKELKKYKQLKQSDKQKSMSTTKEKEAALTAMRGYSIQEVIDSVPKGG